jgi:hypothetical protein
MLRDVHADGWIHTAKLALFVALSFFRFEGESTLRATTANAHRWAAST